MDSDEKKKQPTLQQHSGQRRKISVVDHTLKSIQKRAQDDVIRIGHLMAKRVILSAALEKEKVSSRILERKKVDLEAGVGRPRPSVGGRGRGPGPLCCSLSASALSDAHTQTQTVEGDQTKGGEPEPGERQYLLERRTQLLASTRNLPKNTANMVGILKSRNTALLKKEQRSLQQVAALRRDKERRLSELKIKRLSAVCVSLSPPRNDDLWP